MYYLRNSKGCKEEYTLQTNSLLISMNIKNNTKIGNGNISPGRVIARNSTQLRYLIKQKVLQGYFLVFLY